MRLPLWPSPLIDCKSAFQPKTSQSLWTSPSQHIQSNAGPFSATLNAPSIKCFSLPNPPALEPRRHPCLLLV